MAVNTIIGRAKKFDGSAIDYVSIFDWNDGKCIAQVKPSASGYWEYPYAKDIKVGLTYIADGCEPITHGAYDFIYQGLVPLDAILHYSFNGSTIDGSVSSLDGVSAGNISFVTGRKAGTQALRFIDGYVKTPAALPINNNKVSVSFWIKSDTTAGMIIELNETANKNNFGVFLDKTPGSSSLYVNSFPDGTTASHQSLSKSVSGQWTHILFIIDRTQDVLNRHKVYINNVRDDSVIRTNLEQSFFQNAILYIGKRGGASLPSQIILQDVRVYNRVLSDSERRALFEE